MGSVNEKIEAPLVFASASVKSLEISGSSSIMATNLALLDDKAKDILRPRF